jgi:glutathionylspermidine amidase/synthetase
MVGADADVIESSSGQFTDRDSIYQELFSLPVVGGLHVQMTTFSAAGKYAGSAVRVGSSPLIAGGSDLVALRVIEDRDILGLQEEEGPAGAGYQI